ncbi:MAG: hypothetical protein QOG19_722 [Mycobacterium sp.]|nr:hypothetical protein [Mycobacterium sp.]
MTPPVRIENESSFYGDLFTAISDLVGHTDIDVATGDYRLNHVDLAEGAAEGSRIGDARPLLSQSRILWPPAQCARARSS